MKKGSELVLSLGIHKDSWQLKLWIQSQGNFLEGLGSDSEAIRPPHQHMTPAYLQQASAGPQQAMLSHINTRAVLPGPSSAYTNPHRLTQYTLTDRNTHLIWYSCLVTGWIFLPPEHADVCEKQNQQPVVPIFLPFFGPNRISQSGPLKGKKKKKAENFQFSHFRQRY